MASRFRHRVGRRGAGLLFFALLDLVYAYSLLAPTDAARNSESFRFIADILPLWGWAIAWAAVGVTCLVQAFAAHDRVGFAAAMGLKVLWGVLFLLGGLVAGLERGYVSAAIWLTFAAWIGVIATWPEPGKEIGWTRRSG